ncbi:MAG: amidohydrolase [Coprococcus sp.]|nr:amidohydrolase [Coprococcus sp.]
MYDFMKEAQSIKEELIEMRRFLHRNAEIRDELPVTSQFVRDKLSSWGIENREISKSGIVGRIGKGAGRTILLRADMDALDVKEESGLPFASSTPYGHCCGHDLHTAMLLGAAKILKNHEEELSGTVKLMFQPGEEYFIGSQAMIKAGVLEEPKVDVAVDMHMNAKNPVGSVAVCKGYTCASCDGMKLVVHGKGCHGAWPHTGTDPFHTAVNIYLAFQELLARETPGDQTATLTFGQITGGNTANIIPSDVTMQGTLRVFDKNTRAFLKERIQEIEEAMGKAYRTEIEHIVLSDVPALYTEPELQEEMIGYCRELGITYRDYPPSSASDDFARVAERVPSVFFSIGCMPYGAKTLYPPHNPKILFNEDALPVGTAIHCQCAMKWLEAHHI